MAVASEAMVNSDFLAEAYGLLEEGQHGWVCQFQVSPTGAPPAVWSGRPYKGTPAQAKVIDQATHDNTYYSTAVLRAHAGDVARKKEAFVRLASLVLDDVQLDDVKGVSYAIQTSPGKFQVGIFLDAGDPDVYDKELVDRVMSALAARGRTNDASGNACVRYVRLPVGCNTKPRAAGVWQVRLELWQPNIRWSLADACDAVGINLDDLKRSIAIGAAPAHSAASGASTHAGEMVAKLLAPNPADRVYHDSITRLAAALIAGGMFPGAAVEHLRSLMDEARPGDPAELARWQARRDEIPRAVDSAAKFAPPERRPPQITVNLNKPGEPPERKLGALAPMDWEELAGTEPTPPRWRWDGWLPEGTVTLLAANGGVGKSNLSLQLAAALAHGTEFMGKPTQQSRVLVLSGEDNAHTVHFRVANICADLGIDIASLAGQMYVYDLTQHDTVLWRNGGPTERMQWLADQALLLDVDVIVIDNASDVFASNENDRAEVRAFMRCLSLIAHQCRAAVLLLAHVDKASVRVGAGQDTNSTFSGSTAWNNSARSRWAMTREEDQSVVLRHEKCNLGALQEEVRLEFDPQSKVFKRFGEIVGAAAAAALVRSGQRVAVLRMLLNAEQAGQKLSMSATSNNNAWRALRGEPDFPNVERNEFFSMLFQMQRDGLIEEVEYRHDRKAFKRVQLTAVGRMRAASGSGAPAMWKGQE